MALDLETQKTENVKVFVRLCPLRAKDSAADIKLATSQSFEVSKNGKCPKLFCFDKIFEPSASQLEVYQIVAAPLVDQALNGYNGTIFAYGQSGTGKTFTIIGDTENIHLRGIVPNIFSHILTQISLGKHSTSFLVTMTFIEIYNEEVRDLLATSGKKLEIRENAALGVYVKNLTGLTVESMEQVLEAIVEGTKNRALGATNLNNQSSRSHAVFSITIEARHEDNTTTLGKLNLVDLAGSERVSKSLATGDRLKEAVKINLSLSVLGNVISALVDGSSTYIPYRNSKLTRLLQDSLGGNCMTAMIATVTSSKEHFDETYYTLMYAQRARKIRNSVKKNEGNKGVLRRFEEKIMELQKQLQEIDKKQAKKVRLGKHDLQLQATEMEKKVLLEKIARLQKKILVGGENLIEKAQLQLDLLEYSSNQLRLLDSSHQLLQETLDTKKQEQETVGRKSLSLQEEDALLEFQIKEIEKKISKAEKQLFAKENEYQNEISNLLYTNKTLARDLALANYVIDKSIDEENLKKIRANMFWDEEAQEYRLKSIAHCGNNLKKISLDVGCGGSGKGKMKNRYRKYANEK